MAVEISWMARETSEVFIEKFIDRCSAKE